MYWRVLGQLLRASRGRLAVALIALASGAAVTTALVNLNFDAERKLSAEFRTLGANVVILPVKSGAARIAHDASPSQTSIAAPGGDQSASPLMSDSLMARLSNLTDGVNGSAAPFLYVVQNVPGRVGSQEVIVAGTWLDKTSLLSPWWKISGAAITDRKDEKNCLIGRDVARQLGLSVGSHITLGFTDHSRIVTWDLTVAGIINSGGQEDSQIIVNLAVAQGLARQVGKIGLVQLSIPGTPSEIEAAITKLTAALPDLEVRPVPQLAQAEGKLLVSLRGLIFFMVALILVLTTLCVFASMAALAMERRRDVGLMKAIGAPISRVMSIFLTEAGTLGLLGGLLGYGAGIGLSKWIGQTAFHVSINARLEVLPLVVALMVGVSLAGAFPLRLLGRVRPAVILRGE
jgi:putative ABC transport system permease protein